MDTEPQAWRGVGPACGAPPNSPTSARRMPAPFRARQAIQPGRGGAEGKDPRGQGDVRAYVQSARLHGRAALPRISRERHGFVRARARGAKRATADNPPGIIGRPYAGRERTVAEPGARPAAMLFLSRCFCAGRVPGATSAGRPASGDHQEQQTARLQAGQQSGAIARAFVPCSSSCAMAPPLAIEPGARRAGRAGVSMRAACRTRGIAREPWRGVRAGAARARGRVGHARSRRGPAPGDCTSSSACRQAAG